MTHQDDLHPAGTPDEQPAMELLDGAEVTARTRNSTFSRIVRGGLYGTLLLSASALLAISAVPELSNYVYQGTLDNSTCPFSAKAKGSSCTAHQVASLEDYKGTPCSSVSTEDIKASFGGCCSRGKSEQSVAVTCESSKGSCCDEECPLAASVAAEEPPTEALLTDEQLALLPEGEDLE